jgi:hypothetical protein
MVEEIDALGRTDTWDQLGILFLILLLLFRSRASGSTRFALIALWSAIKCLVACGFQQEYGRDYEETFALVAHRTTIHTLTVSFMRSTCTHLLATLFLMVMFVILYSLKQASRAWFERFTSVVIPAGFVASQHDPALFVHISP